jgi:hypothetical protein
VWQNAVVFGHLRVAIPVEREAAVTCAEKLFDLAQELVGETPGFFVPKGPGVGDRATNQFMARLCQRALREFGADFSKQAICGDNGFRVDYYFPSDGIIVEIALGLPNPHTEFERDVLKAIMAKEAGHDVERLVFISKPGACRKCDQPGRKAIGDWLERNHSIGIDVLELAE